MQASRNNGSTAPGGLGGISEECSGSDHVYRVVIESADNVMAADKGISSDVFCKFKFVSSKKWLKTETVWKTLNPVWGAEFILSVPTSDKSTPTLEFQLFDDDGLMTSDDYLGGASLCLNPLLNDPNTVSIVGIAKHTRGSLVDNVTVHS